MGADGIWNPADYITSRYELDNPYYQGKSIFGNKARANFNKIPQEAQEYINTEIQKRIDSGYRLNKWFLRILENNVKANWPDDVPSNWDISSSISTDRGMANAINKQNNLGQNKRVGNTQDQVAAAKPGDTVLAGGKSVELSQKDIDKAQQNTGTISEENAKIIEDASNAMNKRHQQEAAERQQSVEDASQMTEEEKKNREVAQKAYEEKQQQKEEDWQNIQAKNQEQNAKDAAQAKQVQQGVQQSVQNKSVKDANEEKMQALYGNDGKPSIKGTVDTSGNAGANDQAAINARMNQAQETAKQTYDQTVSDIASSGDAVSIDQRPENLVTDESKTLDTSDIDTLDVDSLVLKYAEYINQSVLPEIVSLKNQYWEYMHWSENYAKNYRADWAKDYRNKAKAVLQQIRDKIKQNLI